MEKNRIAKRSHEQDGQIIATFGEARLVKVEGNIHLRGGSMSDRMEALEWLSIFMPEELAWVGR